MAETSYIIENGRRKDLKDAAARKSIAELYQLVGSGGGGADLSGYYTKTETDDKIADAIEQIELTPGPAGPAGPAGKDGQDGQPGRDGSDGVSATHSWNGTVLTVSSASGTSSADLKGPKGDTGATGSTGPAGPAGPAGSAGPTGPQGPAGIQGEPGKSGVYIGTTPPTDAETTVWINPDYVSQVEVFNAITTAKIRAICT